MVIMQTYVFMDSVSLTPHTKSPALRGLGVGENSPKGWVELLYVCRFSGLTWG
jgi:hypothetical protein